MPGGQLPFSKLATAMKRPIGRPSMYGREQPATLRLLVPLIKNMLHTGSLELVVD
jgi:hypothetical protein